MLVKNPVNCAHGSSPNQARSRGEDQLTDNEMMGTVKTREGLNSRVGRRFLGMLCSRAQAACIFYRCKSRVTVQTKTVFHFHAYVYSQEHMNTAQNYNCHIIHGKDTSKNGSRKKKSSNRSYNLKLHIRAEENTPEIKTYSALSFATRHCLRYSGCFILLMLTIALHEHYNNILAWQMKKLRHKESEVL